MSEIMNVMKFKIFRLKSREVVLKLSNISKTKLKRPALFSASVNTASCLAEVFLEMIFM